jgi:alkylation response protein AidB-like acyl-CoA dehydrogenase
MQLILTEEQAAIGRDARELAARLAPLSRLRALRDEGDPLGFDRDLWREAAALGWTAIPFPEEVGGLGLGLAEVAVVMEGLGRQLSATPLLASVMLAGQALLEGGSEAQRARWLTPLVEGEARLALAWEEAATRADPLQIALEAAPQGDLEAPSGFSLRGEKRAVLDGEGADAYVIAARTGGDPGQAMGISLFLVPADTPGLRAQRLRRVDSRGAVSLRLDDVRLGPEALVGEQGAGLLPLEVALDRARVALSAECLGAMEACLELTLAYLKTRKQFGVHIGSFQALQHRAVDCFVMTQLARTAVMAAARATPAELPARASLAKATCSDALLHIAAEAVQLHGGIGTTDECDVGFYLKRARVAARTLGDGAFHRRRWAALHSY